MSSVYNIIKNDIIERGFEVKRLILILGGARSGKSSYAEELTARIAGEGPVIYVATATGADDEMRGRITRHKEGRSQWWQTIEAPLNPATALDAHPSAKDASVIVVDCLTLLVSNAMIGPEAMTNFDESTFDEVAAEQRAMAAIDDLLAWHTGHAASMVIVSNEVGLGIVPAYLLGRVYRDTLGRVNAHVARVADAVVMLIAGLPIELKSLSERWQQQLPGLFDI
jgi:adenosylcobinamide kinase / adenosylcobinamide-phosphate guanylyltransferase